jgi:heptosyltransferase III
MSAKKDILAMLNEQEGLAETAARQAVIIQPGAIGDCILTLPLAQFMKESLNLGGVVFLSHLGHAGIFTGRTCVDGVKSIESVAIHRLFHDRREFDIEDGDPLLTAFAPYGLIVTFLGEQDSDFEHNLIYTAHCTHSADIITLNLKPPAESATHISLYYIEQFASAWHSHTALASIQADYLAHPFLKATGIDKLKGEEILKAYDIGSASEKTIVIAPGSGSVSKCWPVENFLAAADQLKSNDFKVIFLLGPAESERFSPDVLARLGSTALYASDLSLTEVLQLLSASHGFIGNDSGITHLAGGLGLKTIAIFGTTQSYIYRPCGPNVHTLQIPSDEFSAISAKYQKQIVSLFMQL